MYFFVILENLFHWLFTWIYLVYWYVLLLFWLFLTLFSLASLLLCLLTLSLSINIKHLCLFFHSLPILTDLLKFRPTPFILSPQFIKFNKNLRPPLLFWPRVYLAPRSMIQCINYLRKKACWVLKHCFLTEMDHCPKTSYLTPLFFHMSQRLKNCMHSV